MDKSDELTVQCIVKSLEARGLTGEALEKAMHTAGLRKVKKEIMRNGKPQFQSYWVTPDEQKKLNEEESRKEAKEREERQEEEEAEQNVGSDKDAPPKGKK